MKEHVTSAWHSCHYSAAWSGTNRPEGSLPNSSELIESTKGGSALKFQMQAIEAVFMNTRSRQTARPFYEDFEVAITTSASRLRAPRGT